MKKLSILASMVLGLTAASHAQFEGMGWDNQNQEVVGRLGVGGYSHLEVGVGLKYDGGAPDDNTAQKDLASTLSLSARYLLALHSWEKFTGFLHVGAYFRDDNNQSVPLFISNSGRGAAMSVFVGYEPEVVLLQHFSVSTRFGLAVPVMPDVKAALVGDPVSIVNGFNFRILF